MRVIESSRRERWRDLSSSSFFFSETGSPQRIFNSAPSAAGCCARGEIRKRTRHFQHTENTHSHSVGRSHLVRWVLPINAHSLVRSLPTLRAPATMINPKSLFFLASVASVWGGVARQATAKYNTCHSSSVIYFYISLSFSFFRIGLWADRLFLVSMPVGHTRYWTTFSFIWEIRCSAENQSMGDTQKNVTQNPFTRWNKSHRRAGSRRRRVSRFIWTRQLNPITEPKCLCSVCLL